MQAATFNKIISAYGWTRRRATVTVSDCWLSMESEAAFQRLARGLLATSVKAGIAAPLDGAYLADRMTTNEGRQQEDMTQVSRSDHFHLVLNPVNERELANRPRLATGLQRFDEYEAEG